jgi:hypothetical protein
MTPADGGEGRRQLDHGVQLLADFAATPLRSMAAVHRWRFPRRCATRTTGEAGVRRAEIFLSLLG